MSPFKQTSTPCSDTTNALTCPRQLKSHRHLKVHFIFPGNPSRKYVFMHFCQIQKLSPSWPPECHCFLVLLYPLVIFHFFSHNSFFCMCLHKFWCFQGFPLLGTLLCYTQNPKGFPAQVFYQLYTEPSKNLPPAQISKGLKSRIKVLSSSQVLFLLKTV